MGPCVRCVGWICFISALHSITDWVPDTTNEINGRSRRVLDFLLKRSISENSPFKGQSINFHFLCVGAILHRSQWPGGLQPLACWDCGFESHREHGYLSFMSTVCCVSYIKKYADSWTWINIVYFWRPLLARVQLPGLHKELYR